MKKYLISTACLMIGLVALYGCSTAPKTKEGKADIRQDARLALAKAKKADTSLIKFINNAYAYSVFPGVGKGGIGLGGAYGKGVLYEKGKFVGYCDVSQVTIGFQLGGQSYTEIIAFENKGVVESFKKGQFTFDAQATAVAITSGAGANATYTNGVAVFTINEAGLMYEAAIGGQKFSYQAK